MADALKGRLRFSLTADQARVLCRAAALTGKSVSAFVLCSALEQARELLERPDAIEASDPSFREFVAALDEPAEAVPELVRLFQRHRRIPTG